MAEACGRSWGTNGIVYRTDADAPVPATLALDGEPWVHLVLRDRRTQDLDQLHDESWFLEEAKGLAAMAMADGTDAVARFVVWCPDNKVRWVGIDEDTIRASRPGTMLRRDRGGETRDRGWYIPWHLFKVL
jgi:hypothetical protein